MEAIYSTRKLADLTQGENPVQRLPGEMNYHYISSDFSYPPISRAIIPAQYRQQLSRYFVLGEIVEWSKDDVPSASPEEISISGLERKVVHIRKFPCSKDSPYSKGIYFTQSPLWLIEEYKGTRSWSDATGKFRVQVKPGDIIGRTFFEYGVRKEDTLSFREISGKSLIIFQNISDKHADRRAMGLVRKELERGFKLEDLYIETDLTDIKKQLSRLEPDEKNKVAVEKLIEYLRDKFEIDEK